MFSPTIYSIIEIIKFPSNSHYGGKIAASLSGDFSKIEEVKAATLLITEQLVGSQIKERDDFFADLGLDSLGYLELTIHIEDFFECNRLLEGRSLPRNCADFSLIVHETLTRARKREDIINKNFNT